MSKSLTSFRNKLAAGRVPLGLVVTSLDPAVSELAAFCGCDFVWIDMEHSPLTITDVMHHVMALNGSECATFIRVAGTEGHLLKSVLDLAPSGVILPMINSAEEARKGVALCRYPEFGGIRGFATRRNNGYGTLSIREYVKASENEPLVILQIEHRDALAELDDILAVPGVDSICIGPCDLSGSFARTGDFKDGEVSAAIDEIIAQCGRHGIPVGGFCSGDFWNGRTMDWRAVGDDAGLLSAALRGILRSRAAAFNKGSRES